ncbi:MAG: Zn-ribbon domain-containing OB-fold protein [Acidimicrobiia bacterium]
MLVPQGEGIPKPRPTLTSQPFWDGCRRHELLFQRCTGCGQALFNPTPVCRFCTSTDLVWERSSGRGVVYSWTVAWRPQHPSFTVPYAAVIVDMAEGYQMLANIVDCEVEDVRVGLEVTVVFHPIGDGVVLPYFRPIDG